MTAFRRPGATALFASHENYHQSRLLHLQFRHLHPDTILLYVSDMKNYVKITNMKFVQKFSTCNLIKEQKAIFAWINRNSNIRI